jgi:hypothetical protein
MRDSPQEGETMMKLESLVTAVFVASLMVATAASAQQAASCDDMNMRMGDRMTVKGEDRLAIGGRTLSIRLGEGKGLPLKVVGSSRSGYDILLCKAAAESATLGAIRLAQRGTEVTVEGPAAESWGGVLLVLAPNDADLDLEAANGPVSVTDLAGRLRATVANGPLSLKRVGGSVDVQSSNGPVSFTGSSGDVSLVSQNGPLSINLESSIWTGGELRTSAKNGPISLKVPAGYTSGIVVERGAKTPLRCPVALCGERPDFFRDEQTRIVIGSGPARVHVASRNGPISIKED